ncbi:hypothetical protein [Paenibacillus soyae]|uniref:Lipoprotein n=1 Tax=Paenibacillus soyae TaxID=2969249 RepID=A0A9X2MW27_9BACL|nr:hypothetical protein [Paenibacillus soyae]MCR2807490.1 hypothetical protein [Paenibacillus soyae]
MKKMWIIMLVILLLTGCRTSSDSTIRLNGFPNGGIYKASVIGDIPHTNYTNVSFEAFDPSDEKFTFDALWILDQRTFSTNSDKNIAIMEALLHADILVFIKDDKAPPQSFLEHFELNGNEIQTGGSTNQIGYYLWSENNETRMGKLYADEFHADVLLERTAVQHRY